VCVVSSYLPFLYLCCYLPPLSTCKSRVSWLQESAETRCPLQVILVFAGAVSWLLHPSSSKGWYLAARPPTAVLSARGHFHVLGTRQLYRRDGGSDGDRLLLRQWCHLQRHAEQDCNRCGSSSNHTSTLEYAGRARNATSDVVRRNPTLPVHALLQARSARHGHSTSHSPRRTRWAACRPTPRRSR